MAILRLLRSRLARRTALRLLRSRLARRIALAAIFETRRRGRLLGRLARHIPRPATRRL